jgi:hypothetical protein
VADALLLYDLNCSIGAWLDEEMTFFEEVFPFCIFLKIN